MIILNTLSSREVLHKTGLITYTHSILFNGGKIEKDYFTIIFNKETLN